MQNLAVFPVEIYLTSHPAGGINYAHPQTVYKVLEGS